MPITSQIRLEQLTGSFGNASTKNSPGFIRTDSTPKILAAVGAVDLSGSLSAIASALGRIHGKASGEAFNNEAGTFYVDIVPDSTSVDLGTTAKRFGDAFFADDSELLFGAGDDVIFAHDNGTGMDVTSAGAFDIQAGATSKINATAGNLTIEAEASNASVTIKGDQESGTAIHIDGNAAAGSVVDIDAGVFDVDASANLTLQGAASSEFKTSAGNVNIEASANNAVVIISGSHASGTSIWLDGNSAAGSIVDIDGGQIDIDAANGITIDTADGDVSITADGPDNKVVLKGDHTGGTAIHLDANENAASVIDVDFGVFDADGTTFNVDTLGAINLNAAGVASGFSLTAAGAGQDLTIAQDGSQDASVILSSAGTGVDAIHLNASAGGIAINVVDGQTIAAGLGGAVELMLTPHGTAASERAKLTNTSGNSREAIVLEALAGYVGITGSLGIEMSGSNWSVNTADSGAQMSGGHMVWASAGEFASFVLKPQFSNTTTLVGALNALATAAGGGFVGKAIITGSAVSKLQLTGAGMVDGGGFTRIIDLREATPANTDVFVNGQLLVSGTGAAGTNGDYGVTYADPGAINFQFNLQAEDVVIIKTTADQ